MARPSRPASALALAATSLLTFLSGLAGAALLVLGLVAVNPLLLAAAVLAFTCAVIFFRVSRRITGPHDRPRI